MHGHVWAIYECVICNYYFFLITFRGMMTGTNSNTSRVVCA